MLNRDMLTHVVLMISLLNYEPRTVEENINISWQNNKPETNRKKINFQMMLDVTHVMISYNRFCNGMWGYVTAYTVPTHWGGPGSASSVTSGRISCEEADSLCF